MPKVIINDEEFEAQEGEHLLDVARKNGAHIGFICNGNGLCASCECKILEGADQLTPPNEIEKQWLSPARIEQGNRLGCQATIQSAGKNTPIKTLTRVEALKRQFTGFFIGEARFKSLIGFFSNLAKGASDQLSMTPTGLPASVSRLGLLKVLFPWSSGLGGWFKDTGAVISRQVKNGKSGGLSRRGSGGARPPFQKPPYERPSSPMSQKQGATNAKSGGSGRPANKASTKAYGQPPSKLSNLDFEDISIPKSERM